MSFIERISRGWRLLKLSWHVLMQDKELLVLPALSFIAAILLFIGIVLPTMIFRSGSVLWLAVWYFCTSFVAIYANAALFACVRKRLEGGDPTVGYGLSQANKHLGKIIVWSLISMTVGLILRWLDEQAKDSMLGQIAVAILGAAWTFATMFVVPAMVIEGRGVGASMKRSLELIQKSWGENITQDITIAAVFTVLYALGVAAVVLSVLFMPGALLGVLVVAVLYFLVVALFHGTLAVVSDAVLYQYASGGKLPAQYTEIAKHAFAKKH